MVTACAILDNTTTSFGFGGGIAFGPGHLIVERSTIAGNSADGGGGGILVATTAELHNVTLSDNESVADLGTASTPLDPMLGELVPAGGETDTHEPLAASPTIDAGSPAPPTGVSGSCLAIDQRLTPRPFDGDGDGGPRCDIGAHEAGVVFTDGAETGDLNRWSDSSC